MTNQEKEAWMKKNETAVSFFNAMAFKIASTGKKFGFKAVAERIRWEAYFQKDKDEAYKWSNSITTYAGRKFIEEHPQFANQVSFKEFKQEGNVK